MEVKANVGSVTVEIKCYRKHETLSDRDESMDRVVEVVQPVVECGYERLSRVFIGSCDQTEQKRTEKRKRNKIKEMTSFKIDLNRDRC